MKTFKFLPIIAVAFLMSCSTVNVLTDYDKTANFAKYKTYNYSKTNIHYVDLSDLDKKRVISAIDQQMILKGYSKQDNPDILINLVTDTKEVENIETSYNNDGFTRSWGWPLGVYNQTLYSSEEGILFIDIVDSKSDQLVWQGKGTGYLSDKMEQKDKRAKLFVSKILKTFPMQKN